MSAYESYGAKWAEHEITKLRTLAASGCSASIIGERVGKTRNAVIGKCHRLGIALKGMEPGATRKLAGAYRTRQRRSADIAEANELLIRGTA